MDTTASNMAAASPNVSGPWARNGLISGLRNRLTGRIMDFFVFLID
jgi:hypothetical protein